MTDQLPEVTLTPEQEERARGALVPSVYFAPRKAARLIVHLQDRVRALESESIERFDQARYYAELASCRYLHWTCKTHGDFDARVAVGCPECVRMMREERASTPPAEFHAGDKVRWIKGHAVRTVIAPYNAYRCTEAKGPGETLYEAHELELVERATSTTEGVPK